jgi:hypothetical protein
MRKLKKDTFEKLAKGFPMAKQVKNARLKFLSGTICRLISNVIA